MKIISHRGNLNGRNIELENHPDYIDLALKEGFDVEIDVWVENNLIYLGHDYPTYQTSYEWLNHRQKKLWVHAKNLYSIEYLNKTDFNWFWHQNDLITITSHGNIWSNIGVYVENGITVQLDFINLPEKIMGVCTDDPRSYFLNNLGSGTDLQNF